MAPQFIVRAGDATDRRFAQAKVIICQWRRMCEAGTRPARDLAATGQAARGLLRVRDTFVGVPRLAWL